MTHRDRWTPDRDPARDRDREPRRADFDRPAEDFGQADYSEDYAYDPRTRTGYRADEPGVDRDDFGQADYSTDFGYDERTRGGYRRSDTETRRIYEDERARGDWHYAEESRRPDGAPQREGDWHYNTDRRDDVRDRDWRGEARSWFDNARENVSGFLAGAAGGTAQDRATRQHRRDRVTWAVITGRLDHERRLDARDIEVLVHGGEVTLNGTVRSREEKRLAEDLVDIQGIDHVQNNLRIRKSWWR